MTAAALISESDWLRLRAAWARERTVQAIWRDIMTNEFIYFVIGLVLGMLLGWLVCQKYRELSPRKEPYD